MSPQQDPLDPASETTAKTDPGVDEVAQDDAAEAEIAAADADTTPEEESEGSVEEELQQAQATIQEYWDQIMRLRAEIDNNRKRAERDVENAHKFALKSFAENLLPVIDSMEMGQAATTAENVTLESIREGSELTLNMFVQVLQRNGLEQIDPLGEKFDPEKHQAISMIEVEGAESNSVIEVMQKGFLLNERLIRPAMVVVAK